MKTRLHVLSFFLCVSVSMPALAAECVVLLHGLARTSDSMGKLESFLQEKGYSVANINYPSRDMPVEALSNLAVKAGLDACEDNQASPVNIVTHSLGGILVRYYFSRNSPQEINRVVMLGPPNQGSEVVDKLKNTPGFELFNGPAGMQLGTDDNSVPGALGPVNFELGVIAGTESINLILSTYLPGTDDGKVTVKNTRVEGMCGFVALPATHTFMMRNESVMAEVLSFLKYGWFESEHAESYPCS